jgi:hypothetical protein
LAELEPHLNAQQIVDLKAKPDGGCGEDMDQVMITIPRPAGWQKLIFPNSKSRKPFKSDLIRFEMADRNKQQQNPIARRPVTDIPQQTVPPEDS